MQNRECQPTKVNNGIVKPVLDILPHGCTSTSLRNQPRQYCVAVVFVVAGGVGGNVNIKDHNMGFSDTLKGSCSFVSTLVDHLTLDIGTSSSECKPYYLKRFALPVGVSMW